MSDGGTASSVLETAGRPNRSALIAFLADAESEAVLREGLAEAMPGGFEVRRGNVRTAISALSRMTTPRTLVMDITGDPHPLASLADLAQVLEPDVRVLIVGDRQDVAFYRQVTRGLGAQEYLYKPLVPDLVARLFGSQLYQRGESAEEVRGGRVIAVSAVRGGAGASTIAVNLAWYFAHEARRHTVLVDADLHVGTIALLLGAKAGPGLRTALEAPHRLDEVFLERVALPVEERLHLLASEEKLTESPQVKSGATEKLLDLLRRRYNYIVTDAPFASNSTSQDLLNLAHQRVLVLPPTLPGVRDTLRRLALPNGPAQARRAVVVLNRSGAPGALTRKQVEDALGMTVDVAIPDLPRQVVDSETLGTPAAATRGGFRTGIESLAAEVAFVRLIALRRWSFLPWRK